MAPALTSEQDKSRKSLTEWKDATWHGEDPTRVLVEPLGKKVDVKTGQTVKVHPDIAKRLAMQERYWEVEGYAWVTPKEIAKKSKAKSK